MAIVKKYRSKIIDIQNPISGIFVVKFKSLEKNYKFKPGQYLHLAIDEYNPSTQWPESRCFSMESSPSEEFIKITYAVKGAFTGRMARELKTGGEVYLKLPYGDFIVNPHSKENCVFIAGGTGITPFLSLFNDISFKAYSNPRLYLGFRNNGFNIYNDELQNAEKINPGFKITVFYEDADGVINIEKIFKENGSSPVYFISGPPVMIKSFKEFLKNNGVMDVNIRTDDWE